MIYLIKIYHKVKMKIILASSSPRRKELLKMIVSKFDIIVSGVDETLDPSLTPQQQVIRLSNIKAKDIFDKTQESRVVIGSDTIVVKDGKIYGKPKNTKQAKQMIKELASGNRTHSVFTGLTIIIEAEGKIKQYKTYDEAKVTFKEISDKEIDKWINTGKAMDKAGAYAMQEEFGVFVERIEGNYNTIVGLPIHKVYDILKENKIIKI